MNEKIFQHMAEQHGLTLLESEIEDIKAICSSSASPDGYVAAPRRRVELRIKIGADSWREAADALADIEQRILADGPITSLVSGGWSSGYSVTGSEDTGQTGDNYRKQNAEYVASLKAT